MTTTPEIGRRERKKAATRQALADAALRLFLKRGYDAVTVREIADAADVSTTTLLKHFPSKEALVFDKDADLEASLVAAVTDRPVGTSIIAALRAYMRARAKRITTEQGADAFLKLVRETPALRAYERTMSLRHQDALAAAIAAETGARRNDPRCAILAGYVLDTLPFPARYDNPVRAVDAAFDILEHGWSE